MTLPRWSILQGRFGVLFGGARVEEVRRAAVLERAQRWQGWLTPRQRADLIELGGLYTGAPVTMAQGRPGPADKTPYQCGVDDGRRSLAAELLALDGMTIEDINLLMTESDDDD